jgi:hypothetical protein
MIKLRLLSFSCNTEIILLRKDKSADAGVSAQYTGMGSTHIVGGGGAAVDLRIWWAVVGIQASP